MSQSIQHATQAQERGVAYGFLAWLFLAAPDSDFVRRLLHGETDSLSTSLKMEGINPSIPAGLEVMRTSLIAHTGASVEEICEQLAVQRTRLFRGVAHGYGPPPPYELLYRRDEGLGDTELMLRVQRFYQEAAAQLPPEMGERPDYLGLELDLMRLLCEEESGRLTAGDFQGAGRTRDLQDRFLTGHLLVWVPRFCQVILKEPNVPFYHGVVTLLAGFLEQEAKLFNSSS